MARINWNKSAPYEHIVGKETGEKIYAIMEYLGVGKKHEALRFAIDFTCKELIEKPFKPAEPERTAKVKKGAYDLMRCECGMPVASNYDYCPKCRARLEWE